MNPTEYKRLKISESTINDSADRIVVQDVISGELRFILKSSLLSTKQNELVSGTNIKTVNGQSILGSENLVVSADLSNTQIKDTQIPITANTTLSSVHNGQTLIITESVTITIPTSLVNEFTFNAIVTGTGAVAWAITAPHIFDATVGFNGGTAIATGKYFNFTKVGNNIIIAV